MIRGLFVALALALATPAAAGIIPIDADDAFNAVKKGKGVVKVEGDAEVELVKGKKRLAVPAEVPAGKYKLEVKFPGTQKPIKVGKVTIRKDYTTVIKCDAQMQTCKT